MAAAVLQAVGYECVCCKCCQAAHWPYDARVLLLRPRQYFNVCTGWSCGTLKLCNKKHAPVDVCARKLSGLSCMSSTCRWRVGAATNALRLDLCESPGRGLIRQVEAFKATASLVTAASTKWLPTPFLLQHVSVSFCTFLGGSCLLGCIMRLIWCA